MLYTVYLFIEVRDSSVRVVTTLRAVWPGNRARLLADTISTASRPATKSTHLPSQCIGVRQPDREPKYSPSSMLQFKMRGGIPTSHRPRDDAREVVVLVSGAVRGPAGYRSEYWTAKILLLVLEDCEHQAIRVTCSERVHCADAVSSDSRYSSFTKKCCACASFAFVTGIISCSMDNTLPPTSLWYGGCFLEIFTALTSCHLLLSCKYWW